MNNLLVITFFFYFSYGQTGKQPESNSSFHPGTMPPSQRFSGNKRPLEVTQFQEEDPQFQSLPYKTIKLESDEDMLVQKNQRSSPKLSCSSSSDEKSAWRPW